MTSFPCLAETGLLGETLHRLTPDEMGEIKQRVRRIVENDPAARNALENEGYYIDREQGRTDND